jgi:hypothetical protein
MELLQRRSNGIAAEGQLDGHLLDAGGSAVVHLAAVDGEPNGFIVGHRAFPAGQSSVPAAAIGSAERWSLADAARP